MNAWMASLSVGVQSLLLLVCSRCCCWCAVIVVVGVQSLLLLVCSCCCCWCAVVVVVGVQSLLWKVWRLAYGGFTVKEVHAMGGCIGWSGNHVTNVFEASVPSCRRCPARPR